LDKIQDNKRNLFHHTIFSTHTFRPIGAYCAAVLMLTRISRCSTTSLGIYVSDLYDLFLRAVTDRCWTRCTRE